MTPPTTPTIASVYNALNGVVPVYTVVDTKTTQNPYVFLTAEAVPNDGPVKDAFIYEMTLSAQCIFKSPTPDNTRTILDGLVATVCDTIQPDVDTRITVTAYNVITQQFEGVTYSAFEIAPEGVTAYVAEVRFFFRIEEI